MAIHKIPSSSGRLKILAMNTALRANVRPDMAMDNSGLALSRKNLERWGTWAPPTRGVRVEPCTIGGLYCEVHVPQTSFQQTSLLDGVIISRMASAPSTILAIFSSSTCTHRKTTPNRRKNN